VVLCDKDSRKQYTTKKNQADTRVSGMCDSVSGIACMCGSGGLDSGDSSSEGGGDG